MSNSVKKEHSVQLQQIFTQLFGDADWDAIEPLTQGLAPTTLAVYKITFKDMRYVAKLKHKANADSLVNEFKNMQMANVVKVCPELYYANPDDGILIMDYVESKSFGDLLKGSDKLIKGFANMTARVHNCGTFYQGPSAFDISNHIADLLSACYSDHVQLEQARAICNEIKQLVADEHDLRSCHREMHRANLLFNGDVFYLVDWEASAQDSLYVDLGAVVSNYFYDSPSNADKFFEAYLGRKPTKQEQAKFHLMSVFSYLVYGFIFLSSTLAEFASCKKNINLTCLPSYEESMANLGKMDLSQVNNRQQLGFVNLLKGCHLAQLKNYRDAKALLQT